MHRSILLLLLLTSLTSFANDERPKHMVQLTTRGLGIGGNYEKTTPRSNSKFDDYDVTNGNIALNYAYTLRPRLQLGLAISNFSSKREYKATNGQKGKVTHDHFNVGAFAILNFSDALADAWYLGFMATYFNEEDETTNKTVLNYLEDDKSGETFELSFGKRFSLERYGISHITYSPNLSVYVQRARKDYEDDGLQDMMGVNLELVKFDVLF